MKQAMTLIALTLSINAYADWQYAKWGMRTQELEMAAAKSNVKLSPVLKPEDIKNGILRESTGIHKVGSYEFYSKYYFDDQERLNKVQLILRPTSNPDPCYKLRDDLEGNYGAPLETSKSHRLWLDQKTNNRVRWQADFICAVTYSQLKSQSASGL